MTSLLLLFFTIAIVTSFLCSLWEAVLLSITPSYAQIQLQKGTWLGRRLQEFKEDIDRPLAAILTLNTIAHTVGAIGVGDQAAKIWAEANPLITGLLVPAVMTLAILVLSELIPKTLGANYWQSLAPATTRALVWIIRLLGPLVWFSQLITSKLKKKEVGSAFSRSDFVAMADIGAQHGIFEEQESEIITNLLKFRSVRARDVMTPRTLVRSSKATETLGEFFDQNREHRFSRIPLYENESRDQVIGYVLKDQILAGMLDGDTEEPLVSLKREIIAVPEDYPILELFNRFLSAHEQIALVVDEFGGMDGIVTMEDVIETLLGVEIVDESDRTVDMQVLARRSWEQRARRVGLIVASTPAPESDAGGEGESEGESEGERNDEGQQ
jgi:CBS domain containing-hemolysin-like protein